MRQYYLLGLSLVLLFACTTEEYSPDQPRLSQRGLEIRTQEAALTDEAITSDQWETFLLSAGENQWVIADAFPKADQLKEGHILIVPSISLLPQGALKKIDAIQREGNQLIINVTDAALDEAYKRIHIDFSFHAYEEVLLREFSIKKQKFGFVDLKFTGTSETMTLEPSFGVNGEYVFELDVDFENQVFHSFEFGIRDATFGPELISRVFANAKGSAEVAAEGIPIYSFLIPVPPNGGIPVNIQLVMETFGEVDIQGGMQVVQSYTNVNPIDLVFTIDPENIPSPFAAVDYQNDNQDVQDFQYNMVFEEIMGQGEVSAGVVWNFQATVFNLFDVFNAFFKVGGPVFSAGVSTDFQGSELVANVTADLKFPVEVGIVQGILAEFGIEREIAFELGEPSLGLYDTTLVLPCDVRFLDYDLQVECDEQADRLELSFFCNSNNGSSEGYQLWLGDQNLGTYAYNQQHTRTILAARMSNFDAFIIRDVDRSSCRIEVKRSNPCDLRVYCTDRPFTDARDGQQYCFQEMADGKTWMNSPLLYHAGETLGACHSDNPNLCLDLGRYYTYDELLPGVDNRGICPDGWHVPSVAEWNALFSAEKDVYGTVRPLMAPGFTRFGNVTEEESNGFNVLPTGQMQRWKLTSGEENVFSNSLLESDEPLAIFWSRDALTSDQGGYQTEDGAMAVAIQPNGQTISLRTPKTTGLVCRCVQD